MILLKLLSNVILLICLFMSVANADDYGVFVITGFSPRQGSVNGGTVITFTGRVNSTIVDAVPLSVLINSQIYCDIKDNYLSSISSFNLNVTLFTCVTRPAYSRADFFPSAALTPASTWAVTYSLNATFRGQNMSCIATGGCNFIYNRTLTPILTAMKVVNVDMSKDTGLVGPNYLPISTAYVNSPVIVEISGFFICNDITCLQNVYFNDLSLECLIRNPDDNVPYGFVPSSGNSPAVLTCVFYTMIPGAFMPLVNVQAYGYSLVLDSSLYSVNQYANVSMLSFVPVINQIVPYRASLRGGATIDIIGAGFSLDILYQFNSTAYYVTIGKIPCVVSFVNSTNIICTLQSGWEQQEQVFNDSYVHPNGLSVQWYSAVNISATDVLNTNVNPRFPSLPDRWYVIPTIESPITQDDIFNKRPYANMWDNYGRIMCGDFVPPVNGSYRFSVVCAGTCDVYLYLQNTTNAPTRFIWDNSDPNLPFTFWKPNQASSSPIAFFTNSTYRFSINHYAGQGYDFVGLQVMYPNGSVYAIQNSLWKACYQSDWPLPLINRKTYYGYRGIRMQSMAKYYSKVDGGLGLLYMNLESGFGLEENANSVYTNSLIVPENSNGYDSEVIGYYIPYSSSWYQFSIIMDIANTLLAPETELYLIQDDMVNGVAPHSILLAHTFLRSYLGPAQTSPPVFLQAGHPYLLQYYSSAQNYSVNISVTDVGRSPNSVYNPITGSSIIAAVDYPAVVVQFYGNIAACNFSSPMHNYLCEFQFEPVLSSLYVPNILVQGSVVNMTLDTWSITNIVGNETIYVDSAICPLSNVDNVTRVITCVVSESRFGGVVDITNITVGPWGVADVQDIGQIDSIAPFNVSSSYVYQYYFPQQSYSPTFYIRIVLIGLGFDTAASVSSGHTMDAFLDGNLCVQEGAMYNSLTVLCPASSVKTNYTSRVVLVHSGVSIENLTTVVANPADVYNTLSSNYPFSVNEAAVTYISRKESFYTRLNAIGGTFSDIDVNISPNPIWSNEGYISLDNGNTFSACSKWNGSTPTVASVAFNCSVSLKNLNQTMLKVKTIIDGTSQGEKMYEASAKVSYDYVSADQAYTTVYPPVLTDVSFANFDFTNSPNMSIFSVDVIINGTNYGQLGPVIDYNLLPTYNQEVSVNQIFNVDQGAQPLSYNTTKTKPCIAKQLLGSTALICSLIAQVQGNDTFQFSVNYLSMNNVPLVVPYPQINFTLGTAVLGQEYSAWMLAHQNSSSSTNVVAIAVPVAVGTCALAAVAGTYAYLRYKNALERKRKAVISAQEEQAEAEAAAALEREELGGLTHRKPTGQVFVNF